MVLSQRCLQLFDLVGFLDDGDVESAPPAQGAGQFGVVEIAGGGDDDSYENFQKIYYKASKQMGVAPLPEFEGRIKEEIEEKGGPEGKPCWNFSEPLDRMAF